jgi:hypothetical protein
MGTANFTAAVFPFTTTTIPVTCQCAQQYCYDFTSFTGGPLPLVSGVFAGAFLVDVTLAVIPPGPVVEGPNLRMFAGRVRFRLEPGYSVSNLIVRGLRHDPFSPQDEVRVTHGGNVTAIPNPNGFDLIDPVTGNRLSSRPFTIVCPFTGITEWVIYGGQETWITEICFSI